MAIANKRWLVVLPEHQQEWVKETAEEAEVRGSDVIAELIERTMKDGSQKFKASLAEARTKRAMQALIDKKAEIDQQLEELTRNKKG